MTDDTYYLTPHEAALAVVATGMKKSRLKFDTLIINSISGGILFSAGGMLHLKVQANPELVASNPGLIHLMQGLVYPIGLFYVVIMGAELFNSNVLFFTVSLLRGAVGILDLLINWFVSWLLNLGANLFVCYVICYLGGALRTDEMITASVDVLVEKAANSFIQTFINGIACNFYVCIAIYLQIMCKPLHVKFLMMVLPVFTFVSMGYSHTVADMYLCPMGLMNGAPVSVATYIWKILIPESLGNIVGGAFFAIVVPFYSHLLVVERDSAELGLPKYDARDEQPEQMMDSRVVRTKSGNVLNLAHDNQDSLSRANTNVAGDVEKLSQILHSSTSSSSARLAEDEDNVVQRYDTGYSRSIRSVRSRRPNINSSNSFRSPPGVFPVQGMGEPLEREKTIASGRASSNENNENEFYEARPILSRIKTYMTNEPMEDPVLNQMNKEEEEEFKRAGGVDARDEYLGNRLIKKLASAKSLEKNIHNAHKGDVESEIGMTPMASAPEMRSHNSIKSLPRIASNLEKVVTSRLGHNHLEHKRTQQLGQEFAQDLVNQGMSNKAYSAANDVVGNDMSMADVLQWSNDTKRKANQRISSSNGSTSDGAYLDPTQDIREPDPTYNKPL